MNRLLPAIGILSLALIAFQLVLMQVLALVQWYHFAYMVISMALLGFGASGTLISLFRGWLVDRYDTVVPLFMVLSGLTMATSIGLADALFGGFDSYLLFVDRSQIWLLLGTYLLYFVPFFLGATAIGLVFVREVGRIGSLYFANLLGSGVGGIAALGLISVMSVAPLAPLMSLLPIGAGLLLISGKNQAVTLGVAIPSLLVVILSLVSPPNPQISEYKSLQRTLNLPDAQVQLERSSAHGQIHVVSSSALRHAPGLSLAYTGEIPVNKAVFNNGEWFGAVVEWSRQDTAHLYDYTTQALPYAMSPRESVLLLSSGTGSSVTHALTRGAGRVTAVEPFRAAINLLRTELAESTDSLYYDRRVSIKTIEPRTALAMDTSRYDLIALPSIGAFGGTAGVYALQEQYTLTIEAFHQMWDRLNYNGVISTTSWMDYPVRNPLKVLATMVQVLEDRGVENPAEHIAAIRSWGALTFVLKKTALTAGELQNIRIFARERLFDPLLLPDLNPEERARFNQLEDDAFFSYVDQIVASNAEGLFRNYDFYLRPATDNRPYFSQFLRWRSLPHLTNLFGQQAVPFLEVGYLIVVFTFFQIALLAFLLIVAPLLRIGWRGQNKSWTLVYFSGLGLGFMFLEIVLIQQFVRYLGQPIYAAAAVISTLLVCSGAGSYFSSRLRATVKTITGATGLIALAIACFALILPILLDATAGMPMGAKAILSFVILAPPAFLMGFPFPLGLRFVSARQEAHVPWAWGINGCISVVSAALAMILAVEVGFFVVMLTAAAAYSAASVATRLSGLTLTSPNGPRRPMGRRTSSFRREAN